MTSNTDLHETQDHIKRLRETREHLEQNVADLDAQIDAHVAIMAELLAKLKE